jgi:hypothetical protein
MRKAVVLINFIRIPVPEKIQFAKNRLSHIIGNANFPSPDVSLADISIAIDVLETKFRKAQGGGTKDTAAMHAAEAVLDELMRKLADYVSRTANGNAVIIASAGFSIIKTKPSLMHKPGKPEGLKLTRTQQSGTLISNCKRLANARGFVTIISASPDAGVAVRGEEIIINPGNAQIMIHIGSKRKAKHTNLVPGTKYYIKKFAFNTAGRGPDSDEVSIMAG